MPLFQFATISAATAIAAVQRPPTRCVMSPADHDALATPLATLLAARIAASAPALAVAFADGDSNRPACAWLDDVLPPDLFAEVGAALPPRADMVRRESLGERKYVLADPALMAPPLAALVDALASERVAAALGDALDMPGIVPDPELYNGGLTVMAPGDHMRPHLDNSHDRAGRRRRRLVALFYLAGEWEEAWGGTLVPGGVSGTRQRPVAYRPNRLVLMAAGDGAWHAVTRVAGHADRTNLTTYYYDAVADGARVRLTRFAGWPASGVSARCSG